MPLLHPLLTRLRRVRADTWTGIVSLAVYSMIASQGWIWVLERINAAWHPQGRCYAILMAFSPLAFILYLAITFLAWNLALGFLLFRVLRLHFPDENAAPARTIPPVAPANCVPVAVTASAGPYNYVSVTTTCFPAGLPESTICTTVTNMHRE